MRRLLFPALASLLAVLGGCNVLFWRKAEMSTGGTWYGNDTFIEVQTEFERKIPWYPLNQNVLAKNYETRLLLHKVSGNEVVTHTLTRFPGWVLNGSVFVAGGRVWLVRGTSDALGDWSREVISADFNPAQAAANNSAAINVVFKPDWNLLASVPSPDGTYLAFFLTDATTDKPTGNLRISIAAAKNTAAAHAVDVIWKGVPGIPEFTWAKGSDKLFLRLDQSVFELAATGRALAPSARFPKCFLFTSTGRQVSDNGVFFSRTPENQIELKKTTEYISFESVPMISNTAEIGSGCP